MRVEPLVPVRVLGTGRWSDTDASMGRYVDLYDEDEGDVLRASIEKPIVDQPLSAGDVIEAVLSTRSQAKVVGAGESSRAIEKTQIRLHSFRVVGRLVIVDADGEVAEPEVVA